MNMRYGLRIVSVAGLFACLTLPVNAKEAKPFWQSSACYTLHFATRDKMGTAPYVARYVVKTSSQEFVAERHVTQDDSSNSAASEVKFPDDFRDLHNLEAGTNCSGIDRYTWEIYVNGELLDSGTGSLLSNAFEKNNRRK